MIDIRDTETLKAREAYTASLGKLCRTLRKSPLAVVSVSQNYKGTGSSLPRRQVFVRCADGWGTDLWFEASSCTLGGVAVRTGIVIPYGDRTPKAVMAEIVEKLVAWRNAHPTK